jgi:hypothetical protein
VNCGLVAGVCQFFNELTQEIERVRVDQWRSVIWSGIRAHEVNEGTMQTAFSRVRGAWSVRRGRCYVGPIAGSEDSDCLIPGCVGGVSMTFNTLNSLMSSELTLEKPAMAACRS